MSTMDLDPPDRPLAGGPLRVSSGSDSLLDARRRRRAELLAVSRRRRRVAVGALGAGLLIAGVVLALALPGGLSEEPTIVQAAELTVASAVTPPPERNPTHTSLLDSTISGPAHPYLQATLGWTATGARTDFLGDRQVITVFYERAGRRVGYSIVEGPQLPPPVATTDEQADGLRLRTFLVSDRPVVTWIRGGRTCLVSGRAVDVRLLLAIAAGPGRSVDAD